MVAADEEADYFAVMGLAPGAAEADIRKAYRKLSLALHPDKNRHMDARLAAARFSEMQLAYEVLMDPAARLAAEERTKADSARKERRGAYDGKRKAMAEELDRQEENEKQKRYKAAQEERSRKATFERLREEGKRLREQREQEARQQQAQQSSAQEEQRQAASSSIPLGNGHTNVKHPQHDVETTPPPDLGPLDLTVTLRFPADQYAGLAAGAEAEGSAETPAEHAMHSRLARALSIRFGKLDSVIMRPPKSAADGKSRRSEATAHATFTTLDAAFAAVKAGSRLNAGGAGDAAVLDDVFIGWAGAPKKSKGETISEAGAGPMPGEPARITWMRQRGKLGPTSSDRPEGAQSGTTKKLNENDVLQRLMAHKTSRNGVSGHDSINGSHAATFPSFNFDPAAAKSGATGAPHKHDNSLSMSNDFESATLRRMREAERRRVEEAIIKADEQG